LKEFQVPFARMLLLKNSENIILHRRIRNFQVFLSDGVLVYTTLYEWKQKSANPVVPRAGAKRSARVRSFQLQIYRENTNSKKTVRPESIARAVKKVFESNNADLVANEREHRDLCRVLHSTSRRAQRGEYSMFQSPNI